MADSLGLPPSQWNACGSETSHVFSDFAAIPATHDTSDMHDAHDAQNVSPRIDRTESIRFSNSLTTSATTGFQTAELRTEEYVAKRQIIIADGPGPLSDQAINWIKAREDVQLEMIDAGLCEQRVGGSSPRNRRVGGRASDREASLCQIGEAAREVQVRPGVNAKHPVAQLRLEKDMLLHQVKSLSSKKSELESKLKALERVIQRLTTNQVHATPAPNIFSEPTPSSTGIRGSSEPTPGPSGIRGFSVKSSNLPTYDGKRSLDDLTACLFSLERHFINAAQAIVWVDTTGWGEQAVLQLKGAQQSGLCIVSQ
ncbi:hypothetical protein K440DRAFT_643711 [Wilcoxina mikolae CBS 423.85]|nr:hypothetical protein K440DRAFT_643711 [Wilcoxina mikolae CBS 423.85]